MVESFVFKHYKKQLQLLMKLMNNYVNYFCYSTSFINLGILNNYLERKTVQKVGKDTLIRENSKPQLNLFVLAKCVTTYHSICDNHQSLQMQLN